jgi:hypothetical protein
MLYLWAVLPALFFCPSVYHVVDNVMQGEYVNACLGSVVVLVSLRIGVPLWDAVCRNFYQQNLR